MIVDVLIALLLIVVATLMVTEVRRYRARRRPRIAHVEGARPLRRKS